MNNQPESRQAEFDAIIKKLKRRRVLTYVLTAIAIVGWLFLAFPSEITLMDQVYTISEGWSPSVTVLTGLAILLGGLLSYGYTLTPIVKAIDEECDPEKCLALFTALGSKRADDPNRLATLCSIFFYMGRYNEALPFAQQLAMHKKPQFRAAGDFFCALLGYFMGDIALLKNAALRYRANLAAVEKMNAKDQALFDARTAMIEVMEGLCDGNHQAVAETLPRMKPWSPVPAVTILIDTLKGIAALPRPDGGDRDEAVHRFMTVREKGGRTCLVGMADWYLAQLKSNSAQNSDR